MALNVWQNNPSTSSHLNLSHVEFVRRYIYSIRNYRVLVRSRRRWSEAGGFHVLIDSNSKNKQICTKISELGLDKAKFITIQRTQGLFCSGNFH